MRDALDAAESARDIQPWAATPYLQLALVSEQIGALPLARMWIRRAIARDREDWRSWLVAARLETKLGRVAEAERSLDRAVRAQSRSPLFKGLSAIPPAVDGSGSSPPAAMRGSPGNAQKGDSHSRSLRRFRHTCPPPHSAAVETSTLEGPLVAHLPAAVRADRLWVRRNVSRAWRYTLLRRMLACADIAAAFLWCSALGMASGAPSDSSHGRRPLPVWLVIAKLLGLYDRDERPLRHTTIDEAESLATVGSSGTFALCSCCS